MSFLLFWLEGAPAEGRQKDMQVDNILKLNNIAMLYETYIRKIILWQLLKTFLLYSLYCFSPLISERKTPIYHVIYKYHYSCYITTTRMLTRFFDSPPLTSTSVYQINKSEDLFWSLTKNLEPNFSFKKIN